MSRCRHVHATPSRFIKGWLWCSDCHTFTRTPDGDPEPASEYERVAYHIKRDVLHWEDA